MKYSDIKKLEEVKNVERTNELLALGWRVVTVYKTAYDTCYPGCEHQTPHFVLGWYGSDSPAYPKHEDDLDFFV